MDSKKLLHLLRLLQLIERRSPSELERIRRRWIRLLRALERDAV